MLGDGDEHGGAVGDLDMDMPRFLAREEEALHGVRPPPLPSRKSAAPTIDGRVVALKAPAAVVLLATGLVSVTLAVHGEGERKAADSAPKLITQPVPLLRAVVADNGAIEVRPPLAPPAKSEAAGTPAPSSSTANGEDARLSFAPGLAQRSAPLEDAVLAAPEAVAETAGPAAMLFVSDLPQGATLREGAPAGNGTWIVGGADPAMLHDLVATGFEAPVAVSVEQLDASGAVSGTAILTLHKPVVARAPAAAEPLAKTADLSEGKAKAKSKRKRFAKSSSGRWTASEGSEASERRRKKRMVRDDAYKGGRIARRQGVASGTSDATSEGDPEDKPGVIANFIGWLKGEQSQASDDTASAPATVPPPAPRDDGAVNTFGMFPQD